MKDDNVDYVLRCVAINQFPLTDCPKEQIITNKTTYCRLVGQNSILYLIGEYKWTVRFELIKVRVGFILHIPTLIFTIGTNTFFLQVRSLLTETYLKPYTL